MQRILIIGGGLAGSLVAARCAVLRPELELAVVEQGPVLLGEKTWCFHAADLAPVWRSGRRLELRWLTELATKAWDGYAVRFPGLERSVADPYYAIRAAPLRERLMRLLDGRVRTGTPVRRIAPREVELGDG